MILTVSIIDSLPSAPPRIPVDKQKIKTRAKSSKETQNQSISDIEFVVLRLHCQLKVASEGTTLILSQSGIEHVEDTFRRTRVGGVCQQRKVHHPVKSRRGEN